MTNTEKLIPGEYYWVKFFKPLDWEIAVYLKDGRLRSLTGRILFVERVAEIDCDQVGNPTPIKRPE